MEIRDFYESAARSYDERHSNYATQYMRKFEEKLIRKYARGRVLDLGCGTGEHLTLLENAVGLDISRKMLEHAAKKTVNELAQGDAEELPFKDASFDTALCMFTTLNLCNSGAAVREMGRVLKLDGIAIASTSSVWDRHDRNLLLRLRNAESKRKNVRIEGAHVAFNLFGKNDFIYLFEKNGFRLVKFDSLFAIQKPYWGWRRNFSLAEKFRIKLDRIMPRSAGRMYFGVFKKIQQH